MFEIPWHRTWKIQSKCRSSAALIKLALFVLVVRLVGIALDELVVAAAKTWLKENPNSVSDYRRWIVDWLPLLTLVTFWIVAIGSVVVGLFWVTKPRPHGSQESNSPADAIRKERDPDEVRIYVSPYDSSIPRIVHAGEHGVSVEAEMRSDKWDTFIERVTLNIAGAEMNALNHKPERMYRGSLPNTSRSFSLPAKLANGEYPATIRAWANGQWWSSEPFDVVVPR